MRALLVFFAGDDFLAAVFRVLDEPLLFFAGAFFAVLALFFAGDDFLAGAFLAAAFLAVPEERELLEDDFFAALEPAPELDAFLAVDFFAVPELDAFLAGDFAALLFLAGAFLAADLFAAEPRLVDRLLEARRRGRS